MLRRFGFSFFITIASIILAAILYGFGGVFTTVVLIAIELAFSFDNAIVNAKILERLSKVWQQLFLTIGMVVAILGMRFVFPIVIVMLTADLSWSKVIDDALHHPKIYGEHLEAAHPSISAFGGAFLMVLSLYFLFDEARKVVWLDRIERPLQSLGGGLWLPPLVTAVIVGGVSFFAGDNAGTVLRSGLLGVVSYAILNALINGLGKLAPSGSKTYTGWPAFLAFMYLQLLDASFSFDGVLGAFAITDKVILIAIGLGVGAFWVRSLTVFLVQHGTLGTYKYLEHGAHYAILTLAIALLASIFIEIPDVITGIVGIGIIGASFVSSRQALHATKASES